MSELKEGGAVLDMCCGGRKKCPVFRELGDGSFEVSDEGQSVKLTREQAEDAAAWLVVRLHRE